MRVTLSVLGRFHAYELAKQLHARGALARLITSMPRFVVRRHGVPLDKTTSLPSAELLLRAGWKVMRTPGRDRWWQNVTSQYFGRLAARALKPDQDIFVGWSSQSLAPLRRARELGAITVVERHSAHIETQMQLLTEEYERLSIPFAPQHPSLLETELSEYAEADYISVPSEFVRRSFLEKGFPASKLLKVPLGANLGRFSPGPKHDRVFRVLYCGGITPRKGIVYLLQAFSELALPQSELRLVGALSPEMKPWLKRYAGESIRLVPPQRGEALREQYNQSDVFVLPSIEDGFGMVVPEAMACGLPVLCSRHSCAEDVVEDGKEGFIFAPRDVAALKDRLAWLYAHPAERAEMGARALARVRGMFTWDVYGDRMTQEYERILALRAKPGARVRA